MSAELILAIDKWEYVELHEKWPKLKKAKILA